LFKFIDLFDICETFIKDVIFTYYTIKQHILNPNDHMLSQMPFRFKYVIQTSENISKQMQTQLNCLVRCHKFPIRHSLLIKQHILNPIDHMLSQMPFRIKYVIQTSENISKQMETQLNCLVRCHKFPIRHSRLNLLTYLIFEKLLSRMVYLCIIQ